MQPRAVAQHSLRHLNAFINGPIEAAAISARPGPLSGLSVAIKDNICTFDFPTTCASEGLRHYQSPYDATVVSRLRASGACIVGKTNLDEFGMGSHSIHSAFGGVSSKAQRSAGGSSGGSAVAVATGEADCALGTDTGGSVRLPAAYNDIYGFKPSYGLVSRWGVVAYANSLDTVGYMAKDVKTLRILHNLLGGLERDSHDCQDPTSLTAQTRQTISTLLTKRPKRVNIRFGVPKECNTNELSPVVQKVWQHTLHRLQIAGHTVQSISLPSTRQALSAYYILAPAEASSNLAKYDGVRYGQGAPQAPNSPQQLFAQTRQHGFGAEVRRRILLGAYSLSANAIDNYFMQAQRIRHLMIKDFDAVFALPNAVSATGTQDVQLIDEAETVDALILPTAPMLPPTVEEVQQQSPLDAYAGDVFTVPASLAGLPAISVPVKPEDPQGLPEGVTSVGMQVITQFGDDEACLRYAELLADVH